MTPEEWNDENYPYPNCRSILHSGREVEKRMKEYSDYVLRESQKSSTSDQELPIDDVVKPKGTFYCENCQETITEGEICEYENCERYVGK